MIAFPEFAGVPLIFYNHIRAVSSHKVVIALTEELFNEHRLL
jgi:hypothetical protein